MSYRDGRVTLSAWVDPVVRDHARVAAKSAGVEFSKWIERAVQQAVAAESAARALRDAEARQRAVEEMKRSATRICSLCGRPTNTFLTRNGHECPEAMSNWTDADTEALAAVAGDVERHCDFPDVGEDALLTRAADEITRLQERVAELEADDRSGDELAYYVLEKLPYGYDDGTEDEASAEECVDYAAKEIERLRARVAELEADSIPRETKRAVNSLTIERGPKGGAA